MYEIIPCSSSGKIMIEARKAHFSLENKRRCFYRCHFRLSAEILTSFCGVEFLVPKPALISPVNFFWHSGCSARHKTVSANALATVSYPDKTKNKLLAVSSERLRSETSKTLILHQFWTWIFL